MTEILTDASYLDDRRRVVNGGFWDGRDVVIANMRAFGVDGANIGWTVIATRGERLALTRLCLSNRDLPEFNTELLGIVEIDTDERITAHLMFDPENLDAAFEELDALYPAGEAAPYARTWSAISGVYTSFNRHELPATTPDWVTVDNRPLATFEYRDAATFFSATWDLTPQTSIYIEAVHQLNSFGEVVTHAVYGTSQEGFDAEWRQTSLLTVEGGLVNRCEIFDEMDLAAAVARFDELVRPASLLDNAATRIWDRMADAFNRRHVEDFLALSAADIRYDDRRRGLRDEFEGSSAQRKAVLAMFEAPSHSVHMTAEPIAIRGSRLL